jgi:cyclophilin family peptidyl-prolyl cis-trans isomerase
MFRNCLKTSLVWLVCLNLIGGISQMSSTATAQSIQELRAQFNQATEKLRSAIKESRIAALEFYHSPAAEADDWNQRWRTATDAGKLAASEMKSAAVEILFQENNPDTEIQTIAWQVVLESFAELHLEKAWQISNRLTELTPDDQERKIAAARAALLTNRFGEAKRLMEGTNVVQSGFSEEEMTLYRGIDTLIEIYQHEAEIRESEELADDLPRVELETTQGKIVIELFENQAPETVGNFISLVEGGFYQDIFFHRVVKNKLSQAVAQAGVYSAQGVHNAGYAIYDEFDNEDARTHLRGTVSMANVVGVPNSGSAQFFITYVPIPQVDGHHTAFGRVISDMQVVDSLTATATIDDEGKPVPIESIVPDHIISARVLRKRDHAYKPHQVESEKP